MVAPVPLAAVTDLFTPAMLATFASSYQPQYQAAMKRVEPFMDLTPTSSRRYENYGYPTSVPVFQYWARGAAVPQDTLNAVSYTVQNEPYGLRISYSISDMDDEQLRVVLGIIRGAADQGALLEERIGFNIMQGVTDPLLNPTVPNAPDGGALYATQVGGVNRFGVANGNLLTFPATPDAQDVRTLVQQVYAQFTQFKTTKNEILIDPSVIDQGIIMFYGPSMVEVVNEALFQVRTAQAAFPIPSAVAASNVIRDVGLRIIPMLTARITTNDLYFFLANPRVKPMARQTRKPLEEAVGVPGNSDYSRDYYNAYIQWRRELAVFVSLPTGTIKGNAV